MVPRKEVESFHISLNKTPGGIKRQQAAGELCAAGGCMWHGLSPGCCGQSSSEDRVTSLEDSTLHVTPVTHGHLGAKRQPGRAG